MSQRDSGYERRAFDRYETPAWVTDCVISYIDTNKYIWEPAAGSGKMAEILREHGMEVTATDIETGNDFLETACLPHINITAIVTNPPYELAREFIEHSLKLLPLVGTVAMLLRTDFDHAKTRQHLFGNCPHFWAKIVLTKRIKWFEDSKGQPSFNHAWFIWRIGNREAPTLAYGPLSPAQRGTER
jgi:hypothetical protein